MSQTLLIDWPPSVNSIWRANNGRNILSKEYRKWKEHAGWTLVRQRPKKVIGPVKVTIELTPPDNRYFDLDNRAKAILDLLVAHQIIKADHSRVVRRLDIVLGKSEIPGARVTISALAGEKEAA